MKKIVMLCLVFVLLVCTLGCKIKEMTVDEKNLSVEMKHKLEISIEGDVVKWKDGSYSVIIGVEGMPQKNKAVRFLTGSIRSDWRDLNMFDCLDVADVFYFRKNMTAGAQAIYAVALRKAVLGKIDRQGKPAHAN